MTRYLYYIILYHICPVPFLQPKHPLKWTCINLLLKTNFIFIIYIYGSLLINLQNNLNLLLYKKEKNVGNNKNNYNNHNNRIVICHSLHEKNSVVGR